MPHATSRFVAYIVILVLAGGVAATQAQPVNAEDANIDALRGRATMGATDPARIARWVQWEVDNFVAFDAFRRRVQAQYTNRGNQTPFQQELAKQTAQIAVTQFGASPLSEGVVRALAQVLLDMNRFETLEGLRAGLSVSDAAVRYLCATALAAPALQRTIAASQAQLTQTIQAISTAGVAETDAVALGRIYQALSYPPQKIGDVFAGFMNIFDNRLQIRRKRNTIADLAEVYAFDFFQRPAVSAALNPGQKAQLVTRLAVFLRLDAQLYNSPNLNAAARDALERRLWTCEELLVAVAGNGGNVRRALEAGGAVNAPAVLAEALKWVGDPKSGTAGSLNAAPWNVAVGAP